MTRPTKQHGGLPDTIKVRMAANTRGRLEAVALSRSRPGAMLTVADVIREAIDIGIVKMERRITK